jgi:hypothetical protein
LVSTIGWFLGYFLGFILADVFGDIISGVLGNILGMIMWGAGLGFMVGVLQWLFLPVRVSRAGRWVLANTVGLAVASGIGSFFEELTSLGSIDEFLGLTVVVALGGAVTGILQWLVLRGQFSRAGWWVLASTVGWGLSMAVVGAFSAVGVGSFEGSPVGGVVLGVVTGTALVWLLRQPIPEA